MTTTQLLGKYSFRKTKSEGCNCNSTGKADVYMKDGSTVEVRLYNKRRKFKITEPGKMSKSGSFTELARTLESFMNKAA